MIKTVLPVQKGTKVPIKIWTKDYDANVETQLLNLASLSFIHQHMAVMPDVHLGIGASVGTVIPTEGHIIPAAVGVDIGCGVCAVKLPPALGIKNILEGGPSFLKKLRDDIEKAIPVGNGREGEHKELPDSASLKAALDHLGQPLTPLDKDTRQKIPRQIGTLGGGNHFLEICQDTQGNAWIMLHSGSRYIGNLLAKKHIEKAKGLMKQYFISLPDPDLAYFTQGTKEFKNYLHDLLWAQNYARENRRTMMKETLKVVIRLFHLNTHPEAMMKEMIDCHHNYTEVEHHYGKDVYVTRKGAVRARPGDLGIIPGSMGAKSFIVEGKGNPESFCSCSHGAGRKMSRTAARKLFTEQDLKEQTKGVECRKDRSIVDEIPGAYKDIDEVMENQKDLVEIKYELKQVLCIKGS